jgi:hypothetical protein
MESSFDIDYRLGELECYYDQLLKCLREAILCYRCAHGLSGPWSEAEYFQAREIFMQCFFVEGMVYGMYNHVCSLAFLTC